MPAPTTIDEFLELVRKSGVVDEKRLASHVDVLRGSGQLPPEPVRLATQLVQDGVLTHFQAEQFLQGKWRKFTLGKYKVLERLGAGGMGSVYLCEHILMRRRVAVKVLPAAKAEDSSSLERFYREARAVAALDHPNIVRAYDIDQAENLHFLVMEHVDGSSLQEIIKRTGGMDVLRSAHYMRQAALGLQHAHETAALVHRDIKPGNILVDRNGIVKILDMGLARFFHDEEDMLTKKYDENVLGTADYLAPEQALDSHAVDIRADIYSLGATFYFCLTGRTPFAEGTVAQKLIWHQTRAPKPVRSFRPDVPEGIVAIIDKMMAKDANQRYQSPQELADALEPWTQTPIPPPPDNEMPQFSLAATKALCETGGAGANSLTSRPPSDVSPAPRKVWQVSSGASQATATAPAPVTAASRAPTPRPPARDSRPPVTPAPVAPATVARAPVPAPVAPAPVPAIPAVRNEARPSGTATASVPAPASPAAANGAGSAGRAAKPPAAEEQQDAEEKFVPRSRREREEARRKQAQKKSLLWIVGGVALVVLLGIGLGIYFATRGADARKTADQSRPPILVNAAMPGGLGQALRKARPGDRIVLQVDLHEVNVVVDKPNITIEAEAGKKILWKCPANVPDAYSKLLNIQAPNVTFRGVTLDGNDKTEELILLFSKCPGVKLENLTLRNTKQFGVLILNCEGDGDDPVQLNDLEFLTTPTTTAVRFAIGGGHQIIKQNRFIRFGKCRFEGTGKKLTAPNAEFFDPATIHLPDGIAKIDIVP